MKIVWDERKRFANMANHAMDFRDLDEEFFASAVVGPTKLGRLIAVGRFSDAIITVVFVTLGTEGISVISMRPASRKERQRIDG